MYKDERGRYYNKNNSKGNNVIKINSIKDFENIVYINVRVRLCAATPPSVIANRTPPPPSQKHHFSQEHQINFCNDEIHCPLCGRGRADDY